MNKYISSGVLFGVLFSLSLVGAPDYSARSYYDQAVVLEKSGDTLRATDMLREALRRNAAHVPSLIMLSRLSFDALQPRLADELVTRALKLEAQNVEANILCARIAYAIKNYPTYEKCLTEAAKVKANNPDLLSLRAQSLIDNGQYALARRKIDAILRDNPGHIETHVRLARLYLKLKQFARAEAEFRKVQSLLPDSADIAVQIARARLDALMQSAPYGDFSAESDAALRALDALKHAYSNNSENFAVTLMLGQLLAITGRCGEAQEYLKKLVAKDAESRSVTVYYALCDQAAASPYLAEYLKRHEDDDLTRHQAERLLVSAQNKREQAKITRAARYHRNLARRSFDENTDAVALAELRWAEFLFPGYLGVHRDLLRHFRIKKDYERMADELIFLRDTTQERDYREMFEQFDAERRDLWYNKAGVAAPEKAKNPLPVHIYPFRARDPLIDHPLGGVAIADRTRVALIDYGRMRSISPEMSTLPQAVKFSPENLRTLRQTYGDALRSEVNPHVFSRNSLALVLVGDFAELTHGVEIKAELIDAETGIRTATIEFKATGRDFLNRAAQRLANFVYTNTPVVGNILKIEESDRVLVNLGKRDGVRKDAKFSVVDKLGRTLEFSVTRRDFDIATAKSATADATQHLKAGDRVQLVLGK